MIEKFKHVTAFVFDMDGVLTDGTLLVMNSSVFENNEPKWIRRMSVKDGYALQLAVKKGYAVIVISGSVSAPVKERLAMLGISDVHFGVKNKKAFLLKLLQNKNIKPEHTLFMGDDIPDMDVMKICGMRTCPQDACAEIKETVHYISPYSGGNGCVRDVIEKVLRLNHHWTADTETPST